MNHEPIHILSTKNLDASIIQQAASENIIIDCIPFIQIQPLENSGLKCEIEKSIAESNFVIFTSANAVNAVKDHITADQHLKGFCICGKTRKAIERQFPNFEILDDAPNGAELAGKIVKQKIDSAVFFCGNKRLDTIPDTLRDNNIGLKEIVVYETNLAPQKINKNYDGILFFSPSAVESFFSANPRQQPFTTFSFAGSTLNALRAIVDEIRISEIPSEQGMLNIVKDYYKNRS